MNWDWLKSRYTKSLERRITEVQQEHALAIREINTAHAKELDYVKNELAWHKEETERLRRFLLPTMQPVYDQVRASTEPISTAPQAEDPYAGLTPFQKMQKKDLEQQELEFQQREEQRKKQSMTTKQPEQTN